MKKSKEELESILEVFSFVLERSSREFISLFYVFSLVIRVEHGRNFSFLYRTKL